MNKVPTIPSPILDQAALLHRLNDATKPVDAADRNLIIRALSTAPTTGSAPEIASGPCLIVKGSGETDLPIVHIVHSLEEARHAVLSLMYSDPADAEDTETLFAEFEDELTDGNYWSIAFEIGGISVERVCLDVALLAASMGGDRT